MLLFANAKINIGLNITSKRPDGFHNLETCFFPVGLSDIIEFKECNDKPRFSNTGIVLPDSAEDNLCIKAWKLLKTVFNIPPVEIHLHKQIPVGAGLGGGSSDAAFMLKGLNSEFKIGLSDSDLEKFAVELGSDCAFFIHNRPAFAKGKGELLEAVSIDLSAFKVVLINPGIHISTAEAYSSVTPCVPDKSIAEYLKLSPSKWQDNIVNDFEKGIFSAYPEIREIKEYLIASGAHYSAMSGSGSTVFGLFEKEIPEAVKEKFHKMFVWWN